MIGVRGSGGSAPITDATATASDIVSGKVAYNNNGRIVGTHTESGTVITDATATASDIVSGKVAYNNYGRIVGTHTESGIIITDATATANDIVSGKVAYGNNGRIVGTLSNSLKTKEIFIPSGTTIASNNYNYMGCSFYYEGDANNGSISGGYDGNDASAFNQCKKYSSFDDLVFLTVRQGNFIADRFSMASIKKAKSSNSYGKYRIGLSIMKGKNCFNICIDEKNIMIFTGTNPGSDLYEVGPTVLDTYIVAYYF